MWYYVQNGQQAGPVAREELQGYFQSQSLPVTTSVWCDGMPTWLPANQVPELMSGVAGGYLPQPAPGAPYAAVYAPPTNSMALTSMILGLLGLLGFSILTSIPAIVCGHIARRQIRNSPTMQSGDGMATAGLITGYLVTVLSVVFIAFMIFFIVMVMEAATSSPTSHPSSPSPVTAPAPVFPSP